MIFSYNWLQSFFKKRLPEPKKLAEFLARHAFEVSEVKKTGSDFILDIDVLPNRADCFSHLDIARECSAILNSKCQIPNTRLTEDKELNTKDFLKIEVKSKDACSRYTARVITDVKVGPSPKWIQERLKVCGLKPINNIVDIANYVMLETGQPLHAFGLDKLKSKKIVVRWAKKSEKITTLDGEKYSLNEKILVIADAKEPIAIAGIKGGKKAEITKSTRDIVLESANFDSVSIYKNSRKLKLTTDASFRFEHKLDPNLTEFAISRAAYLVQKIAGGKVTKGVIDVYSKKVRATSLPKKIKLDLNYVKNLLGIDIPEREIRNILGRLGFKLKSQSLKLKTTAKSSKLLVVEVPTRRLDISIPEDLIEEIGRIYGYQKIPTLPPLIYLASPSRNEKVFYRNKIREIISNLGFSEVYNYSFLSEKDINIFQFKKAKILELENPISENQKYLRPSLIPNLLKNVQENFKYFKEIKIFEIGKIYLIEKGQSLQEVERIGGAISRLGEKGEKLFYELKGQIDSLINQLGITDLKYEEYFGEESFLHPKKKVRITIGGEIVGSMGEINLSLQSNLDLKETVALFEIDSKKLIKYISEEKMYLPPSKYPALIRDLALLVPLGTKVVEVLNEIHAVGGPLIQDIDLFDIYEGENIPGGMKNFAFHLIYQAKNRTLTSEEVDKIQKKIIYRLENELGWQVRK